jgi:hypothetical protein
VNSITGGTSGAGNGTIMSYCHLLSGGYANIAMTFGLGHPYGVLPDRVPNQMAAYVQSRAQSNPSCLSPIVAGPLLTVTKSGTGSGNVTSDPAGISCGTDCTQNYTSGQSISLTATAAAGSQFGGWGGACSSTNVTTSVILDADKTCTATFNPVPATLKIHVGDLDNASTTGSRNRWNAGVKVTVDQGNADGSETGSKVSGATVTGSWSNGTTGSASCTTNSAGQCTLTKSSLKSSVASVTFTVTGVSAANYTYDSPRNHDSDGDSTGTTIVVKP